MLDSGWVAAIASLISALIIVTTAIAAFLQLRHNRNANDIVVYLRLIDTMDAPAMVEARDALALVREKLDTDPGYREQLRDPKFRADEFRDVATLLRFLEHISVLITRGGVAEGLVLAEYADTFVESVRQNPWAAIGMAVLVGFVLGRATD